MIRKLTGRVVDTTPTEVVVDVQGVGYVVRTTRAGTTFVLNSEVSFWTYLAVRETALDLYGFDTRDELQVFELLLTIPKIGPKSASQILSQADVTLLKQAVQNEDSEYLSKMSGIGKKSASNIVQGLKGKFDDMAFLNHEHTNEITNRWQSETVDALIALGYPQKDARDTVLLLPSDTNDTNEALKLALRQLSN